MDPRDGAALRARRPAGSVVEAEQRELGAAQARVVVVAVLLPLLLLLFLLLLLLLLFLLSLYSR